MKLEVFKRMVELFDITYHIAKHEKPFAYFPALINLEKRHGVDLGDAYKNPKQAQVFTWYLAGKIQDVMITRQIRESRYISILVDGSTGRSTLEKEVVYCRFLHNHVPVMKFVGVKDTECTTANGILSCNQSQWTSKGLPDWKGHLVGFGAGGASVNFGCRQGIYRKRQNEMLWLMGIHCVAHRLEHACKNQESRG